MKKIIIVLILIAGFMVQIDCVTKNRTVRTVPEEVEVENDSGMVGVRPALAEEEVVIGEPTRVSSEEVIYEEPGVVGRSVDAAGDVAESVVEAPAKILGVL